jgi:hypothetical protein
MAGISEGVGRGCASIQSMRPCVTSRAPHGSEGAREGTGPSGGRLAACMRAGGSHEGWRLARSPRLPIEDVRVLEGHRAEREVAVAPSCNVVVGDDCVGARGVDGHEATGEQPRIDCQIGDARPLWLRRIDLPYANKAARKSRRRFDDARGGGGERARGVACRRGNVVWRRDGGGDGRAVAWHSEEGSVTCRRGV